ncbi:MAG: hypothetical protein ABIE47_08130 [Pseudomonadota bacterium]
MPGAASSFNRRHNNQNQKEDINQAKDARVTAIGMQLRMDEAQEESDRAHAVHDIQKNLIGEAVVGEKGWEKYKNKRKKEK